MYARFVIARQNTAYEECLCCGYVYDAKPFLSVGEHADLEMSESIAGMDVTYTQANAAGGAVKVDILPGAGSSYEIMLARITNSGTNGIIAAAKDTSAVEIARFKNVSSGAATTANLPLTGTDVTSSAASATSEGRWIAGTDTLSIEQTAAGAQNDTLRITIRIRVKGALPTVSKARSTNAADVSATAGAASFAFVS